MKISTLQMTLIRMSFLMQDNNCTKCKIWSEPFQYIIVFCLSFFACLWYNVCPFIRTEIHISQIAWSHVGRIGHLFRYMGLQHWEDQNKTQILCWPNLDKMAGGRSLPIFASFNQAKKSLNMAMTASCLSRFFLGSE